MTENNTETIAITDELLDHWQNDRLTKTEAREAINVLVPEVRKLRSESPGHDPMEEFKQKADEKAPESPSDESEKPRAPRGGSRRRQAASEAPAASEEG